MKIAIMGAGAFGTALGGILAFNGYDVDYYDSKLEQERLSDVLEGAGMVVLCVPSKAAPFLLPYLPKDKPLIVATKGMLTDKLLKDFSEVMVLSGPGFASDIKEKKRTALTVTDPRLKEMFKATHIEFDETGDVLGVLMCGALKNVYAIYAGYLRLEPGGKENGEYLRRVAREMKEVLSANGAEAETVELACGKGDLKLTCAPESRNYSFGFKLADEPGCEPEGTVEGLSAIRRIRRREIVVPEGAEILKEILKLVEGEA